MRSMFDPFPNPFLRFWLFYYHVLFTLHLLNFLQLLDQSFLSLYSKQVKVFCYLKNGEF